MTRILPSTAVLSWVLATLVVTAASGWTGFRYGEKAGQLVSAETIKEEAVVSVDTETLQQDGEIRQLRRERDVAKATLTALRDQQASALKLSQEDTAELELYRRIASESATTGLSINSLVWQGGNTNVLQVTLLQARGRGRVSGTLGLALLREVDGESRRLVIQSTVDKNPARFDFRFFQTLHIPVENMLEFQPDQLEIDVSPVSKRHKPFQEMVDWGTVLILD
jgi:hypothetical protein